MTKPKALYDKTTAIRNRVHRTHFCYTFPGNLSDLKVEKGAGAGFEAIPYSRLKKPDAELRKNIIDTLLTDEYQKIYDMLVGLVD